MQDIIDSPSGPVFAPPAQPEPVQLRKYIRPGEGSAGTEFVSRAGVVWKKVHRGDGSLRWQKVPSK